MNSFKDLRVHFRCRMMKSGQICFVIAPVHLNLNVGKASEFKVSSGKKENKFVRAC